MELGIFYNIPSNQRLAVWHIGEERGVGVQG